MNAASPGTPDLFSAGPADLQFHQADRWYRLSACERYSVSKADMGPGAPVRHRYTAWRRGRDGSKIPTMLGCFDSGREAEDACRDHLQGRLVIQPGLVVNA